MTDTKHIVCPHCHTTNRIPTLALFVNGKEVARQLGAMGLADIVRWTKSHL